MKTNIVTNECIIVYPELFEPTTFKGSPPTFKAVFLFERIDDLSEIRATIQAAAELKFPNKSESFYSALDIPLRDGNQKATTDRGEIDEGSFYYNRFFINAKSKFPPDVVDIYRDPLKAGDIYGGCRVRAFLNFYGFEFMAKRGVGCSFNAVVKIGDGDPIGGGKVNLEAAFAGIFKEKPSMNFGGTYVEDDIGF